MQGPLKIRITASLGADPAPVKFSVASQTLPAGTTRQPEASDDALDCTTADAALTESAILDLKIKTALPSTGASALVLHASVQGPQVQGDASDSIPLTDGAPQGGANADTGVAQQFLAPQCATIPVSKTSGQAAPPASLVNGLSIAKALGKDPGPCTLNTNCSFDITVTNTTGAAVPGPISFFDIAGINLTTLPLPAGVTATGPFTCAPDNFFKCIDNDSLPAGQSLTETITVPVSALLVGPAGQNCALLSGGLHPSCIAFPVPPDPPSKDLKIVKTGPASCAPDQACTVSITITNTGTADRSGSVVFTDIGLPDQVIIKDKNIATPGPADALVCTPGDPSTCTFDGTIAAGQTQPFDLSFTPTAPSATTASVNNCAMLEGDSAAPSCIKINVPAPAPAADNPAPVTPHTGLTLGITANEASCALGQPGCTFTVTASNEKQEAVPGPFEVHVHGDDVVGTTNDPQTGGSGWTCDGSGTDCNTGKSSAPSQTCRH